MYSSLEGAIHYPCGPVRHFRLIAILRSVASAGIRVLYSSSSISGVKLVNRLEFKSGAVVLQYVPNR